MKTRTIASLLVLLNLITVSCTNELSKNVAASIISEEYPTFCTSKNLLNSTIIYADREMYYQEKMKTVKMLKELEQQGLIIVKEEKTGFTSNPDIIYSLELSENSKEKYDDIIALTTNEFNGVLGLSQTENEALVRYSMKSVKTPLYPLHYQSNNKYQCYETQWEEEMTLIKFDTGWKIKK